MFLYYRLCEVRDVIMAATATIRKEKRDDRNIAYPDRLVSMARSIELS